MVFNMEIVKSEEMACNESTFATVVAWKKRRYEIMYAKAWSFNYLDEGVNFFEEENNTSGRIGDRIFVDQTSMPELLAKYAGIMINEYEVDDPQVIFNIVKEELNRGMPVFSLFDQYYLPWVSEEEKTLLRQRGALLIIGIDEENSELYCLDVHGTKTKEKLPIKNFLKGCASERKQLITFQDMGCENLNFNWPEIFLTALENINMKKTQSAFDEMRALADDIEQLLDFNLETKDCLHQSNITMLNRFKFVCRARLQFVQTLKLLNDRFQEDFFPALIEKFSIAQINWRRVASPFVRAFLMKNYDNQVRLKMASEIRKAADFEEQVAEYMMKLCEGKCDTGMTINGENASIDVDQIVYLDLKNYMNNKAFAGSASEEKADFNGLGDYFLTEGLPTSNIVTVETINYHFLIKNDLGYDNISCAEQIIPVPNLNYEDIMIMGCSEWEQHSQWGSFSGIMEIFYENGPNGFIEMEFSDWGISPICGEKIAWEGFSSFNKRRYRKRIFSQKYKFDKGKAILKIKLPNCKNMHIFAIALIK